MFRVLNLAAPSPPYSTTVVPTSFRPRSTPPSFSRQPLLAEAIRGSNQYPASATSSARRAVVIGFLASFSGSTGSCKASVNVEVLRALERRKQSREQERAGISDGLPGLRERVTALRELLQDVALETSMSTTPSSPPLSKLLPRVEVAVGNVATLSSELGILLRCVRPTFDRKDPDSVTDLLGSST